jgi:hypothetical protein
MLMAYDENSDVTEQRLIIEPPHRPAVRRCFRRAVPPSPNPPGAHGFYLKVLSSQFLIFRCDPNGGGPNGFQSVGAAPFAMDAIWLLIGTSAMIEYTADNSHKKADVAINTGKRSVKHPLMA